jgi:hypothetical protein
MSILREEEMGDDHDIGTNLIVVAGHSRSKNGVASFAYDPGNPSSSKDSCED